MPSPEDFGAVEVKQAPRPEDFGAVAVAAQKVESGKSSKDIPTGMRGGLEAAASLASGQLAGPLSGYAGIAGALLPGPPGQGADWANKTQEALTYQPRTDMGQRTLAAVSAPFEMLARQADRAGSRVAELAGPAVGAGTNALLQLAPYAIAKGLRTPYGGRTAAVTQVEPSLRPGATVGGPAEPAIGTGTIVSDREPALGAMPEAAPSRTIPDMPVGGRSEPVLRMPDSTAAPQTAVPAKSVMDRVLTRAKINAALPPDAEAATAAGYRLTPTQLDKNAVMRALEGLSGSAKMEKLASLGNQKTTNSIIADDIGLPKDKLITTDSLETSRKPDYAAYEAVKSSAKLIKPDQQFKNDLQGLRGDFTSAANAYPDLMKNDAVETLIKSLNTAASPRSMVELTRKLRKDAASNLKAFDDPEKQSLGMAQRNASGALEDLIERALTSVGKKDLVSQWQQARTHLAKTYDVESALNETTGDVSARYLAKLYDKGKPLSGGMETAAKAAQAFEGSLRDPSKMRDASEFGYGDLLLGGLGGAASHVAAGTMGGAAGLGLVLARPVARHILLSRGAQRGEPGLVVRAADAATASPNLFALAPSVGLREER